MVPWHIMIGIGVGVLASILTIFAHRRPIEAAPKCEYTSPPDEICNICLDNMSNNEIRYLPCGHGLHEKCFQELRKNQYGRCPLCRQDIRI